MKYRSPNTLTVVILSKVSCVLEINAGKELDSYFLKLSVVKL